MLTGSSLRDLPAIAKTARELLESGIELVVVSMGKQGAFFVNQHETLHAAPPPVAIKGTVAAGDAMVAGLVNGLSRDLPLVDCARQAVAYSLSIICGEDRELPSRQEIENYASQVILTKSFMA